MGCWNETCMLSNLPIFHGDDVKLLFLLENRSYQSRCHSTFQHSPFPFILSGKYNDYGDVEDIESELGDFVLELWFSEFDMWDDVFAKEHDDKLIFKDVMGNPSDCRHVMIRSDIYDSIIPHTQLDPWNSPAMGLTELISDGKESVAGLFDAQKNELYKGLSPTLILSLSDNTSTFFRTFDFFKSYLSGNAAATFNRALMSDRATANRMVEIYSEMIMLIHYLEMSRKSFYVPSGSGSQDDQTKYQRLLAEATLKIAENIDTRWDDEEI